MKRPPVVPEYPALAAQLIVRDLDLRTDEICPEAADAFLHFFADLHDSLGRHVLVAGSLAAGEAHARLLLGESR